MIENQPGERLIQSLEVLRTRLNNSGVERTQGLRDSMGDNCSYYRKSLDLFLDRDYEEIKALLEETLKHVR